MLSFLKVFVSRNAGRMPAPVQVPGRSEGQGSVLAFMTLESRCTLDVREGVVLLHLGSRTASPVLGSLRAVGSGVGISSFTETRAGAPRGREPGPAAFPSADPLARTS